MGGALVILARKVTEQEILWEDQSAEGCRCLGSLSLAMVVGNPGEADLVVDEAAGDPGHEDDVAGPDGDVVSTPLSFRLLQYLVNSTLVEESRDNRSQKITR